jgi:hypothetical protein
MSAVGDKNLLTKAMSEKEVKLREMQQIRRRISFLRHGTNAFFQAKLKKRNLTLVMWCIITHPSAFSHRQQQAGTILCAPQARMGMRSKCKRFHEKKETKRPVSCQ